MKKSGVKVGTKEMKELLLYLAGEISKNCSSIGFMPFDDRITFMGNSNPNVLSKMANIFSKIIFLDNDTIAVCDMPVSEAKYYLNVIAAFFFGKYGIIGPLNFISKEKDIGPVLFGKDMGTMKHIKIIKIGRGVKNLKGLRIFFEKFSAGRWQKAEIKKILAKESFIENLPLQLEGSIAQEV